MRFDFLLKLNQYERAADRSRALLIYVLLGLLFISQTAYIFGTPLYTLGTPEPTTLFSAAANGRIPIINLLPLILLNVSVLTAFLLVRRGQLEVGSWTTIIAWLVGNLWTLLLTQANVNGTVGGLMIFIVAAALLKEVRGLAVGLSASMVSLVLALLLREPAFTEQTNTITLFVYIGILSTLLYLYLSYFRSALDERISETVDVRRRITAILTEITDQVAARRRSDEITQHSADLIRQQFPDLYQVRLYRITEGGAEARVSAEALAEKITTQPLMRSERASVGGLSSIGQAAYTGKAIVQQPDGLRFTEAVFPMRIGTRVKGALVLRTTLDDRFNSASQQASFQDLADVVALALDSASQFERAEERLQENQKLVGQMQTTLHEVERLNQRLTGGAWAQFLRDTGMSPGLRVDYLDGEIEEDSAWTPTLSEAASINHIVQDSRGQSQVIAVPLRVRGQVVGAMEFELDAQANFTPEDLELVQEVSERFGLAVENTRLVQESQRLAQRESLVGQISARLQGSNDMQSVLREAANGLREALKAERVAIKLGDPGAANGQAAPASKEDAS